MKIRIYNNKLRFRLKQQEVTRFEKTGMVTETIRFGATPEQQMSFTLKQSQTAQLSVICQAQQVTVEVPETIGTEWTTTELVGFDDTVRTKDGIPVYVLVEKDFECIDGRVEDNEDTFPNPAMVC